MWKSRCCHNQFWVKTMWKYLNLDTLITFFANGHERHGFDKKVKKLFPNVISASFSQKNVKSVLLSGGFGKFYENFGEGRVTLNSALFFRVFVIFLSLEICGVYMPLSGENFWFLFILSKVIRKCKKIKYTFKIV